MIKGGRGRRKEEGGRRKEEGEGRRRKEKEEGRRKEGWIWDDMRRCWEQKSIHVSAKLLFFRKSRPVYYTRAPRPSPNTAPAQ